MRHARLALGLATCVSLLASVAAAAPGHEPAATLLLPYFEVDLANLTGGITTLFSVNNAGDEPVVAHVVIWTDWGIPTYSFDLALGRDDLQTINLRDLFATGRVPATDAHGLTDCQSPVLAATVEAGALEALRRRHSGRPAPSDGLCYSSGRMGPDVVTGYVTVDVVTSCSGAELFFPGDSGYFRDFETSPLYLASTTSCGAMPSTSIPTRTRPRGWSSSTFPSTRRPRPGRPSTGATA